MPPTQPTPVRSVPFVYTSPNEFVGGDVDATGGNFAVVWFMSEHDPASCGVVSVTQDGVAMTAGTPTGITVDNRARLWMFWAPMNTGTPAFHLIYDGDQDPDRTAMRVDVFNAVDLTTPFGTPVINQADAGTPTVVDVPAIVGELIIGAAAFGTGGTTSAPSSGQTTFGDGDGTAGRRLVTWYTTAATTADDLTMSAPLDGWGMIGVVLKGASGGGGGTPIAHPPMRKQTPFGLL